MVYRKLNRRTFLRNAALGAGAAALSACGRSATPGVPTATSQPTARPSATLPAATATPLPTPVPLQPVEITTSGWPVDIFTAEEVASDPSRRGAHEALQVWLENNPGVTLKKVAVNIWDPQTIPAQVAAGTDCTFLYGPCVGGGWERRHAVSAFSEGQLADITSFIDEAELRERVNPPYWENWSTFSSYEGRFFSYPLNEFIPGNRVFLYRRDLLEARGVQIPEAGWTWEAAADAMRAVTDKSQRRFGFAAPTWFLSDLLSFYGADLLTLLPSPEQPQRWTRDWSDPRWVEIIEQYRSLLHREKVIFSDGSINGDSDMLEFLRNGNSVFAYVDYRATFSDPSDPNSLAAYADRRGMKFDELFGIVPVPTGDGYQKGGEPLWGPVSFSPNQTREQIEKAISLVDWMFFGRGLDIAKTVVWEETKSPRAIFCSFIYLNGRNQYEGVPAVAEDAWGSEIVSEWKEAAAFPVEPRREMYFSIDGNRLPGSQLFDSLFALMTVNPDKMEIKEQLQGSAAQWNTSAGDASGTSREAFRLAAQAWYEDLEGYLKTHLPGFYATRFKPFYQEKVLPLIR